MSKSFIQAGPRVTGSVTTAPTPRVVRADNADVTLTPGEQVVYATATTRDVNVHCPASSLDGGISVSIKAHVANGYKVNVIPFAGDTIDLSSATVQLTQDGEAIILTGDGVTNWIKVASGGALITPPPTPDAPNVYNSSTFSVYYSDELGNENADGDYYGFKGVAYLPTADTNYSHLREVRVIVTDDAGADHDVADLYQPYPVGGSQSWKSDCWPRPESNVTFPTAQYVCRNDDSATASNPKTFTNILVTEKPAVSQPTSVSAHANYSTDSGGNPIYNLEAHWTKPTSSRYWFTRVKFQWAGLPGPNTLVEEPDLMYTDFWPLYAPNTVTLTFVSVDHDGNETTAGAPTVTLTVAKPVGDPGHQYADQVTGPAVTIQYRTTVDGAEQWRALFAWTPPADARSSGFRVTSKWTGTGAVIPIGDYAESDAGGVLTDWFEMGLQDSATFYFTSFDAAGNYNTIVDGVTPKVGPITIGPQTAGKIPATRIDPNTLGPRIGKDASGNLTALVDSDNIVTNGSFQSGTAGWGSYVGLPIAVDQYHRLVWSGLGGPGEVARHPCKPNSKYKYSFSYACDDGKHGGLQFYLQCWDYTGVSIDHGPPVTALTSAPGGAGNTATGTFQVPANAYSFCVFFWEAVDPNANWYVWNVYVTPVLTPKEIPLGPNMTDTGDTIKYGGDAPQNMILNGGFEDGLAHYYTAGNVDIDSFAMTGKQSLRLLPTGYAHAVNDPYPCRPGDVFYAEAWVRASSTEGSGEIALNVWFADKDGGHTSVVSVIQTDPVYWTKISLTTPPAPADSSFVFIELVTQGLTGYYWNVDNVYLSKQSVPKELPLGPNITDTGTTFKFGTDDISGNMLMNPGFEDDLQHWTPNGAGCTITAGGAYSGNKYVRIVGNGDGIGISQIGMPARPGENFYAQLYVWAASEISAGFLRCHLWFMDAPGTTATGVVYVDIVPNSGGGWKKWTVKGTAPAGTSWVNVVIYTGGGATAGYAIDNVYLSKVAVPGEIPLGAGLSDSDGKIKLGTDNLANLVMNPSFEDGLEQWWDVQGAAVEDASQQYCVTGSHRIRMSVVGGGGAHMRSAKITVHPGDKYYVEGYHEAYPATTTGFVMIQANYWTVDGNWTGVGVVVATASPAIGGWTKLSGTFTVPTGCSIVSIDLVAAGDGGLYWDSVYCCKVSTAAEIAIGAGLADSNGNLVVNPGAGLAFNVDGSVYIPQSGVKDLMLADGNAVTVSLGLPGLPNADYPVGKLLFNTNDGKLYRNVANAWVKGTDPADLVAGTIAAGVYYGGQIFVNQIGSGTLPVGVIYTGVVNASQVNSGDFSGCTLTLNRNNVTTNINNGYDIHSGGYAGIKISDNVSGSYTIYQPMCTMMFDSLAASRVGLLVINGFAGGQAYGSLQLSDYLSSWVTLDARNGLQIYTAGFGSAISLNGGGITIGGNKVVGLRQTGPGNPNCVSWADVNSWLQTLIFGLRAHGLFT